MFPRELEKFFQHFNQLLPQGVTSGRGRLHQLEAGVERVIHHGLIQAGLAAEIIVERWLGDVGDPHNLLDRGALIAAVCENTAGGVQNPLARVAGCFLHEQREG